MLDITRTTTVLLEGLRDAANGTIWSAFDARYRPLIIAFARRLGLDDADAADVAQETLVRFLQEYRDGRYDRERGRLRSWLIGIARYRVAGVKRARGARREAGSASRLVDLDDDVRLTRIWENERRRLVLRAALDELRTGTRLRETSLRAFELLVLRRMPVPAVAEELGISAHDVYLAKSRIAERLRGIVTRLEAVYEGETP